MKIYTFVLLGFLYFYGDYAEIPQRPLCPLNVGNSWTYEQTIYYEETSISQIGEVEIKSSNTIDGITGFSIEEYSEGDPVTLVNNDIDGNCVAYFFDNSLLIHNTILYKKNVKKDDHWDYKTVVYLDKDSSIYDIEQVTMTCVAVDTLITTPKGDFKCIGFSFSYGGVDENGNHNNTIISYISENVGEVKTLLFYKEIYSEIVLIDYHIN